MQNCTHRQLLGSHFNRLMDLRKARYFRSRSLLIDGTDV